MTFVSYAQNDEDILLWRALKSVERGFYIDVGAAIIDGYSVSRAFYEHGWRGVNIEPVPELCEAVRAARPEDVTLCVALGATDGERDFFTVPETGLSTLDPRVAESHRTAGFTVLPGRVSMQTLREICRQYAKGLIHYLKIDVEGAEAEVLAGADFSTFRPWILVIEATRPGRPEASDAGWEPGLLGQGYRFAWFDGLNRFYVAAEQEEALAPYFRTPPNVWDKFVRFGGPGAEELAVARAERLRIETVLAGKEKEFAAGMAAASAESFRLRRAYFEEVEAKAELALRLSESGAEAGRMAEALATARQEAERLERLAAASSRAGTSEAPTEAPTEVEPGHDLVGSQPGGRRRITPRAALKRLLRPFWRLARVILRPLAWRTRGFLLGSVQDALADLRTDQERLTAELNTTRERLTAELSSVRERLSADTAGAVAALLEPVEAALTTLATAAHSDGPPDCAS